MTCAAVGVTLVALLLARFLPHRKTRLIGVGLAGSVSGIAIITEVALYVNVHGEMEKLGVGAVTKLGSGSSISSSSLPFTSSTIWDLFGRSLVSSVFV